MEYKYGCVLVKVGERGVDGDFGLFKGIFGNLIFLDGYRIHGVVGENGWRG